MREQPYLSLRQSGDGIDVKGAPRQDLGLRIDEGGVPGGVYGGWRWDGGELVAWNDRYGFFPLFYRKTEGRLSISPSPVELLAPGGDNPLDHQALAVFFRLGFFIKEDTPWKDVKALPPGATLRWDGGQFDLSSEGRFEVHPSSITRSEAIDAFGEAVRRAVARRLPREGEAVVPLSGGADSRHLLLELLAAGVEVRCVTARYFPNRPNHDARVATELATQLDVPIEVVDHPASELDAEIEKNELTGYCADEHAWFLAVVDHIHGLPTPTSYDGLGGDVMTTTLFLNEHHLDLFEAGRLEELADSIMKDRERTLGLVLPRELRTHATRDIAFERVVEELKTHVEAPNPIASFLFWNRTRREISLMSHALLGPSVVAHTPFLDHEVVDLMARLPARFFLDRTFHREAIARAHPTAAAIPYAPKRAARERDRSHVRRYARSLARHWLTHAPSACRPTGVGILAVRAIDGRNKEGFNLMAYLVSLAAAGRVPTKRTERLG